MSLHQPMLERRAIYPSNRAYSDTVQQESKDHETKDSKPCTTDNKVSEPFDPRGIEPCFANRHLTPEYTSYDPPRGYTAEEIMQFKGAKDSFESVDDVRKLIELRDKHGSLEGKPSF
ncbi:hypothetical protein BT96DRAFT_922072 [Gymnopus androsaceus JB14]|uniref:Uncharacterized protein n=1 Tax=Gymnopus androsaceus JB14 TaxID=1447944 RepID=A0A6A4HFB1_9AGAR|nr:hypothetical protein BT96DRAFT_922072 [Gymnopus androsaceus JB14]